MSPSPVVRAVETKVSTRTFQRGAPSAVRIPNSRVRCSTEYATTLARPIAARPRATNENTPKSAAMKRSCDQTNIER